jgi:hypothetical protein
VDPKSTLSKDQHPQEEFVRPPFEAKKSRWGLRRKTFWDWLQLLVVPLMLALITVVFTWQQDVRQNELEEQRAEAERMLAEQRAQDEALQAYLDQMSGLLLEKNLRESEVGSEARTLAQARTLSVLARVDGSRKFSVVQFLYENGLVTRYSVVVDLSGANLSNVDLSLVDLRSAELSSVFLDKADLSFADLTAAEVSNKQLNQVDVLAGATMPIGQKYEEWLKSKGSREDG